MRLAPLSMILFAGCGPSRQFIALPDAETTVLLHRSSDTEPYASQIFRASDPVRLETEDEDVYALLFGSSAEQLGLTPEVEARCLALQPDRTLKLSLPEETLGWTASAPAPPEVFEAFAPGLAERCDPCSLLETITQLGPTNGRLGAAAWLESGRVLVNVASADGVYNYAVSDDGLFTHLVGCPLPLITVVALPGNRFIGGGPDGLVEMQIDEQSESCTVIRTATAADVRPEDGRVADVQTLSIFEDASSPIYALTDDGGLFEYRNGSLQLLERFELHALDLIHLWGGPAGIAQYTDYPEIARLGPREMLISVGWDKVYHWRDGAVIRTDQLDIPEPAFELGGYDRVTALANLGAKHVLAGSTNADVFSYDQATSLWSYLHAVPAQDRIGAFARYRDGIVATVQGGRLVRWHPESGLCPTPIEFIGAQNNEGKLLLVNEDEVIVADFLGEARRPGGLLRLSPPR